MTSIAAPPGETPEDVVRMGQIAVLEPHARAFVRRRDARDRVDQFVAPEIGRTAEARDEAVMQLEQRESELGNKLSQTEAELRAAMDGLRDARQEAEEMRAYIERMHSNSRS